jgi:transposase-like protein
VKRYTGMLLYRDEKVQVVRTAGEELVLEFKQPHALRIPCGNRQAVDDEVIRMLRMRTLEGRKYFVQQEVGRIIGVSRQMINRRWQVYQKEGLLALLAGAWEKSKITPALVDRLAELVVENPFLFLHELKERLQAEGICEEISEGTLGRALDQMPGRRLIMLMREKSSKRVPEAFVEAGYLIERLFGLIEGLLAKVQPELGQPLLQEHGYAKLRQVFYQHLGHRGTPTEKDKYLPRKKLARDCRRKVGFLQQLLGWMVPRQACPDCHGTAVRFFFKRTRFYVDARGIKHTDYSRIYRCCNPGCRTKYFTVPPKGVELYARVHRQVKKMALRWVFHLRGSLSRVCDELAEHGIHVALTTVLRWVKKAGEECVPPHCLCPQEDWEQPLCIDEKWIKLRGSWSYVFTAVGARLNDLLAIDVFFHKDHAAIKTFLLQLKALGFRPQSIVTDLLLGYERAVKEVFPQCRYSQCVLHAERDAKRIVRQTLPDDGEEGWRRRLTRAIRTVFQSTKLKQLKKRYARLMLLKPKAPEAVQGVFQTLENYYPKLCQIVGDPNIPRSTNPVERAIAEFAERYQLTKGFTSFYHARFFLRAFQIYYRLRRLSFGPSRGRNRLQLKGNPLARLSFADYLTPTLAGFH